MSSPGTSSKRRSFGNQLSVEEQALNIIAKEADTREEKSSAILAEARKIRSSEREKNRKDDDIGDDEDDDDYSNTPSQHAVSAPRPTPVNRPVLEHLNSREEVLYNSRLIRRRLKCISKDGDIQENYRKLMMSNVQLDNEKRTINYQLELLKDLLSDKMEEFLEMKMRSHKTTQERDRLSHDLREAKSRCEKLSVDILQRDHLIKSSGLSLVTVDSSTPPPTTNDLQDMTSGNNMAAAVLTAEHLEMLADYAGSLGDRLKQLFDSKLATAEENKQLQREIESLRSDQMQNASQVTSPSVSLLDAETQKQYNETKLKLKRAEQEITSLQGMVTRLETQMQRYKTSTETLEKTEEELKAEKRKLQIELRESKGKIDDLESKNTILLKRIDKLKAKNLLENN